MESPRFPTPRAHSPTKSPAKGLEKLIAELKLERQKCTNALQERSKLKIELEKVKQSLQESQEEFHATEIHNQRLMETFTANEKRIYELEAEILSNSDDMNQLKRRNQRLEEECHKLNQELNHYKENRSLVGRGDVSDSRVEELESTIQAKNEIIHQLENELKQLKRVNESTEKKLLDLSHVLELKNRESEDVRALHLRIEEVTSSHHRLQQTCEDLRRELEDSLDKNADLSSKLKEVTEMSRVLQNNEQRYKMEISQLTSINNKHKQEISDYELIHHELNQRIEAEMETSQISKSLTHDAIKSKESYEKQIEVLKVSYDDALKRYEELEEQTNELNSHNLTLQSELSAAREELSQKELLLKESEEYKIVASEVHQLRSQLIEIRKKIIYNNYTEEMNSATASHGGGGGAGGGGGDRSGDGGGAMRTTLEKEKGNRRVYESIIEDLRNQLEKMTTSFEESQRKMAEMRTRVMKMEELQEELDLYKETAKKVALENHNVVSSINEAHERNERTSHEMNNRLRDLKAAEAEVYNLTIEKERMVEEMEMMKTRVREMMLEKLSAERKMSEAIARNTRNESTIDNWRLRAEKAELELGRKDRMVQEQQITISDLKAKRAESDRQRLILLEKSGIATSPASPHPREDKREEELELIQLRQIKEILEKELNTLKKSLKSQKDINAEQLLEIKRLHEEIGVLKKQKELFQMDIMKQQSTRTEYQLNELRKDISETTLNWEITEQSNQRFQELAERYQEMIRREQEKVVLLETQNQLLEERMEMMKQELNIFRSLDIYEATITSEMRRYHESRSPLSLPTKKIEYERVQKSNEGLLLSSDDDYDGRYQPIRSLPSPASVPVTLSSPSPTPTPTPVSTRGAGQTRVMRSERERFHRNVPLTTWRSEMKGGDDDHDHDHDHQSLGDEEEVGPELVLKDMTQSPSDDWKSSNFSSLASHPLREYNSRPFQDSKQITPSLSKLSEERESTSKPQDQFRYQPQHQHHHHQQQQQQQRQQPSSSLSLSSSYTTMKGRDTLSWKPTHPPPPPSALLNRYVDSRRDKGGDFGHTMSGSGNGSGVEPPFRSSKGERPSSASPAIGFGYPHRTTTSTTHEDPSAIISSSSTSSRSSLRAGGLSHSSRPSKDEFERAKKLLSKR